MESAGKKFIAVTTKEQDFPAPWLFKITFLFLSPLPRFAASKDCAISYCFPIKCFILLENSIRRAGFAPAGVLRGILFHHMKYEKADRAHIGAQSAFTKPGVCYDPV